MKPLKEELENYPVYLTFDEGAEGKKLSENLCSFYDELNQHSKI